MKIGVLGAGVVGSSFGKALVKAGHEVMFSSRNPQSDRMQSLLAEIGANAQAGTVAETLAFSNVIAIAIAWDGLPDALNTPGDWSEKILIDMTNRYGPAWADNTESPAKDIARMTGGQVVKAFNIIGAEHYLDPMFDGEAASMLIAGDSAEAKQVVSQLVEDMGFEVVDAGDLDAATHLEALAGVWIHLAFRAGHGRNIAFRLLRR